MGTKLGRISPLPRFTGGILYRCEKGQDLEHDVDIIELVGLAGPGVPQHAGGADDDGRQAFLHGPAHLHLPPELGHEVVVDEFLACVQFVLVDQPFPLGVHHCRAEVDQVVEIGAGLAEIHHVAGAPVVDLAGHAFRDEEVEGARQVPDLRGPAGEVAVIIRSEAQVRRGDVTGDGA